MDTINVLERQIEAIEKKLEGNLDLDTEISLRDQLIQCVELHGKIIGSIH